MLSDFLKRASKTTSDHSPAILTAIGVVGTITTAYLTAKASFKTASVIIDEESERIKHSQPPAETKEILRLTWQFYVPAAMSATLTIGAIICANRIGTRRAAAMATAYTISERAYSQYRAKVVEKMGTEKEELVRAEIAQEKIDANPPKPNEIIIASDKVLFRDAFSGRYFHSTVQTLRRIENDINRDMLHSGYASLSEYYDAIGLKHTSISDEIGWTAGELLELSFVGATTGGDDPKPCFEVDFSATPVRHFDRLC